MPQVTSPNNPPASAAQKAESNRTFWIYTGYFAAALGLLGVLAYHFSGYFLK
jgi:hypothetical protein